MIQKLPVRHGNHFISDLKCHLILVTKYRRKVITSRVKEDLISMFTKICSELSANLLECNGEEDHIHLLLKYHPSSSISNIARRLKGISSRFIRSKNYSEISKKLWGSQFWSDGYYVTSCGGVTVDVLKKYIEAQDAVYPPAEAGGFTA